MWVPAYLLLLTTALGFAIATTMKPLKLDVSRIAPQKPSLRSRDTNIVPLLNEVGTQFLARVTIDDRVFHVQVDTGSADLWFGCEFFGEDSAACEAVPPSSPCPTGHREIVYGSGRVCLDPRVGSLRMGPLVIPGAAYSIGTSALLMDGSQGILGLAFPSISPYRTRVDPTAFTLPHLHSFSMFLTHQGPGSTLILNGVDTDKIQAGRLVGTTIPLVGAAAHWSIAIDHVVAGDVLLSGAGTAIVDSGSTFLTMPQALFDQFLTMVLLPLGCALDTKHGYYVCPAHTIETLPTLTFALGPDAAPFQLHAWDYTWPLSASTFLVQMQATPRGAFADRWVLGDAFLKIYPTTYHVTDKAVTFYCRDAQCQGGTKPTPLFVRVLGLPVTTHSLWLAGVALCVLVRYTLASSDDAKPFPTTTTTTNI
ncbi:Aste57867_11092 [Aphanomyces stellatus]|uniref:Aste57867_11092 protein n=1 Tax=Aphanomyces stellatus TaxID=120398 RepID=A0A485KRZ7_9STRA|nr:hypothetical protein As57867_011050 [Aphanomyces stellatus]VFT87959.1 Aste57867_11092 [Aphanomyces stellatus]